jgi:hypothetical protein
MKIYNDESSNPPLPKHIGIWDDRTRFLGVFSSYTIPEGNKKPRRVGIGDHLITCTSCAVAGREVHPSLYAIVIYIRFGNRLYTASWPTWARF